MSTPRDIHARLQSILTSGEAIERALLEGDVDRAQEALQERASDIATLPSPPEAASQELAGVIEQLKLQGERLQTLTRQKMKVTAASLTQLARASAASDRYGTLAAAPTKLDTAPRNSFSAAG